MSLHPVKSKGKPHARRSARLRVEHGWETGEEKGFIFTRKWKALILLSVFVIGLLSTSAAYYQFQIVPNLIGQSSQYDPFTLLWNGTITGQSQSIPSTIVSQANGGSSMGINTPSLGAGAFKFGECFTAPSNNQVSSFTVYLKKTGSPTGTISGRVTSGPGPPPRSCDASGSDVGDSSNSFDASTLGTAYSAATFSFSTPAKITSGSLYSIEVLWANCPGCTASDYVTSEIASTGVSNQNGYTFQPNAVSCASPSPPIGVDSHCPTTYDLHFSILGVSYVCANGFHCVNGNINGNNDLVLSANATSEALALSNSPVNVATTASKELLFFESWHNETSASLASWGWYLTSNSTLPNGNTTYNPLTDQSVQFAMLQYPSSNGTGTTYTYMAKDTQGTLLGESGVGLNPFPPNCPQTATIYTCNNLNQAYPSAFTSLSQVLNFTGSFGSGGSNGASVQCSEGLSTVNLATFCTTSYVNQPCTHAAFVTQCGTLTFPWLNILSGSYYIGFWVQAGETSKIDFGTANVNAPVGERANAIYYWVPNPVGGTNAQTDTGGFFGWLGRTLAGPFVGLGGLIVGGFSAILNTGGSIVNAFISAIIQAGGFLIQGLSFLESLMVGAMNAIGNGVGFGNVGNDMQSLINNLVSFFTNGSFANSFGFLGTGFTYVFNGASIAVSWFNVAVGFVNGGLSWAVSSIGFVGTALYWFFLGWSTLYGTIFILLWFIDLGDYGPQGGLFWFDTMRWLFFGTGIGFIFKIINLGLDAVTYLIGLIPKPLIQMVAHAVPRLPIIEASGSPVFPDGHMEAARSGNVFTVLGWMLGFFFTVAYEGSTLPGSIGAFVPGAQASTSLLTNTLPLMEIMLFMGGLTLVFILPAKLGNAMPGLFEKNLPGAKTPVTFRAEAPARTATHVGVRRAEKRFQRRLERKIMARTEFKKRIAEGRGLERT